ncbi:type II 3-dehydroquinate dehydratase [Catellatospora vulcania]|uniref:type II 3-dehydroquinate dehydratase n=1 Tax=Catellatospora vulcania TaxID=1460450 RepID=UPI0012D43700|nr:type II 3-dehydroquinate dehydratase [Catellatospora vulcania]
MTHRVFVLNGPRLDLLGRPGNDLHGKTTLADIEHRCAQLAAELGLDLFFAQTDQEDRLVAWVHEAKDEAAAVVVNPADLAYSSIALLDALGLLHQPVVEVHLANIFRPGPDQRHPITIARSWGFVVGLGPSGYELALRGLAGRLAGERH